MASERGLVLQPATQAELSRWITHATACSTAELLACVSVWSNRLLPTKPHSFAIGIRLKRIARTCYLHAEADGWLTGLLQ